MNAEELKKAREICQAATGGKWIAEGCHIKVGGINIAFAENHINAIVSGTDNENYLNVSNALDNAEFIAFARTALPAALDEIERLQKENEHLHQVICAKCHSAGIEKVCKSKTYECEFFKWKIGEDK